MRDYVICMTIRIDDSHLALVLQDEIRRSEEARYDHRRHAVLLVAKACVEGQSYSPVGTRFIPHFFLC
jgi:hypothetical protein